MNIIEAIRTLLVENASDNISAIEMAVSVLGVHLDRYDALTPTLKMWAEYPFAQWYAIDASEEANWYEIEPEMCSDSWWHESATESKSAFILPVGIDWRLCKWQRPEVTG